MTKLQTKISWLLFMAHGVFITLVYSARAIDKYRLLIDSYLPQRVQHCRYNAHDC